MTTILPAGTFSVKDYRRGIPDVVKFQALLELVHKLLLHYGCPIEFATIVHELASYERLKKIRFDHRPPLVQRDYDTEFGDFIPSQNNPEFIEAIYDRDHDYRTFGRKPDAEKTVTTAGSDINNAEKTRHLRLKNAVHDARIAAKSGDYSKAAEILSTVKPPKPKRKIPSRPWPKRKKELRSKRK